MILKKYERCSSPRIVLIGAVIVIGSGILAASMMGEISFTTRQELKVTGELHDTRAIDLSGNGMSDVIALSELEGGGKSKWLISIFHQDKVGKLSNSPDHVIVLDSLVTLISPGVLPESGMGILTCIAPGGVYSLRSGENRRTNGVDRLINSKTPSMTNSNQGPVFFGYCRDWNGDGRSDMLVFDFTGFSFLPFDEGDTLVLKTHIDSPPRLYAYRFGNENGGSSLSDDTSLRLRYDFPVVKTGEYDGDGRTDLFISSGVRLSVSIQEDWFDYSSPMVVGDFSEPARRVDTENRRVKVSLADFNGDGIMDVSETWWFGTGLSETEAEIRLYIGRGRGGFRTEPDQVLRVKDALPNIVVFKDLDGDGKDELIVPTMNLGIMSFVRILTSGVMHIKALIFDDDPGKVYEEEPYFVHSISAKFDFSGTTNIVTGLDDFDGDGNMDFVFGARKNEISVFRGMGGKGNRIFSRDPVLVLRENANGFLKTDDLNGDGRKDLLLYYPTKGLIRVYFSKD